MPRTGHLRMFAAAGAVMALSACSSSTGPPSGSTAPAPTAVTATAAGHHVTSSSPRPQYDTSAARREAERLLTLIQLPHGAHRSAGEPHGGGASLASYSVNVPVVPDLVDLHEYFVVPRTTPSALITWIERHAPRGSIQGDNGAGSPHGEQWTSFDFRGLKGFAVWPDITANVASISQGAVALRIDAQAAPSPRLPTNGRGPGDIRIAEAAGVRRGTSRYELRCVPAGGTAPAPARICAAIASDPALLYSFPGPDHSCPPSPVIKLSGTWNGKPLRSTFSVCTGGQEEQAGRWSALLGARRF